jgi:colanic acid/amylovoran biosynthesis glycosyltransferase
VPVVVTRQGGVSELVEDGTDGVHVDARNPQELARGLEFVARNPDVAVRISLAARHKVVRGFDCETSARAMVQLLRGDASSRAR